MERSNPRQPGDQDRVVVGRIIRPHGPNGLVRVGIESDNPHRFVPSARFRTDHPDAPLLILKSVRPAQDDLIAEFAGITSKEQSAALVGHDLMISPDERRALRPDEFWPDQLVGLEVRVTSAVVGRVVELVEGPQDRLRIVKTDLTFAEVPFVKNLVPEVNLEEGWLRIDPPEGLLD
ncbi:MAG: ribosome maturation factor RimM [bacterium]|nr:ribosome maturation factor RimM [bacterium]